jgi:N-acetylglucosaminyl-diphospho-decaprenol L-rhamnosyltransferase
MIGQAGFSAADIAVVVVSYNTRDLLERCIQTILPERPAAIVVIDNASPDGSAAYIAERFPDVQVVANSTNVGYGAAINQAMDHTSAPLVLVLNADTELQPGCLAILAERSTESERAGIVAPTVVSRRGQWEPSAFPFPGTLGWLFENAPLAPVVRQIPVLRRRSVSLQPIESPQQVPWVKGCAMLLRRECLESIGGFDEQFFMYYEEVDLCRRATDAGWEVYVDPRAVVMHVGAASTSQAHVIMTVRHFESTMRYYHRYFSGMRLAFWVSSLRLTRRVLLARDSVQLLVARDAEARMRLRERREAWAASLAVPRDFGRRSDPDRVRDERPS